MTRQNNIPLKKRLFVNPAVLLFIGAVVAIIWANSPWKDLYYGILSFPINVTVGSYSLFAHGEHVMTLSEFVNDALMAIFFFLIGLEIRQEIVAGELSTLRKAMLPVIGAIGGMVVPVLVFLLVEHSYPCVRGAAIPMATDIAFALAVLSLLDKRVPLSIKVFLTTLAVADDIGGILVIAIFYTSDISFTHLFVGLALLLLSYLWGKKGLDKAYVYYFIGFLVWTFFLQSGIHTTIAGVMLAMTVPAKATMSLAEVKKEFEALVSKGLITDREKESEECFMPKHKLIEIRKMEKRFERTISPVQFIEHDISPLVNFFVLPLFALVNAGVTFGDFQVSDLAGLPLAIFLGLFFGKTVGIFTFTYLAVRFKMVHFPAGMNPKNLFGIAIFGGIGFTVSLFMATLAYSGFGEEGMYLLDLSKLGVILGSVLSGLVGYFTLRTILKRQSRSAHVR